ncbi:RNA polymerase II mediator complex subunit [Ciborinia camelliae]|nr:RNA polymerase II mediator complex subunit [Ciborinia camelliae]
MADRLTQLQDAIDELALQFVASLVWVNKHHDYQILSQTDIVRKDTKKDESGEALPNEDGCAYSNYFPPADITHLFKVEPLPKDKFEEGQRELAQDLITKEQQIEMLITSLPGLENSENDQQQTIQRLERELKEEEERRKEALKEKEAILAKLEGVIRSVKRP